MVSPGSVEPESDVVISAEDAAFLSLGLGHVEFPWDVHSQLTWRWGADGLLSFFHGKTRREFMRLRMGAMEAIPGATGWRVDEAVFEHDDKTGVRDTAAALAEIGVVLSEATQFRRLLREIPGSPEEAVARVGRAGTAPVPVHLQAAAIRLLLPARVDELVIRHTSVPVPPGTHVLGVRADRDSVRLDLEGDAVLWLTQAPDMLIGERRLATASGGVLFWPGEWVPDKDWASVGAYVDIPGMSITCLTPVAHALTHSGHYLEELDLSPIMGATESKSIFAMRLTSRV